MPSTNRSQPRADPADRTDQADRSPSIDAVGGFKVVGEGGVIGAVPAIVNAVADTLADLDVNINNKPLRPALLSRLIHEATS